MKDQPQGQTGESRQCTRRQTLSAALGAAAGLALQRRIEAAPTTTGAAAASSQASQPPTQPALPPPRADGRFISTLACQHARLKQTSPALAYDPGADAAAFQQWRLQVRQRLQELLKLTQPPVQPPPKLLGSQSRQGYELQKWELYPEPLSALPVLVLVPDGVSERAPAAAVLCFPGTGYTKEGLAGEEELPGGWRSKDPQTANNQMALEYVRQGLVAVAVDNPGVGELSSPSVPGLEAVALQALWAGSSYEGLSVFHKRCVLDWLKQQPIVRADRIAVSGHSLGAKYALHLAVLDESLAALVYNDNGANWRGRAIAVDLRPTHVLQYVPGLMEWFDYTDLFAAVAPRPLLITEGMRLADLRRVRSAWDRQGAAERFQVVQQPRYQTAAQRKYDDLDELPTGLTYAQWNEYAYVDGRNHFFKREVAVSWLREQLMQ